MSHSKATTDNGKELHLYSRIGMYNEKVLSFFNAAGSDYDFTDVGLEIGIKKNRGDDDFITLTEGDGITITGNDVHFVYDEEQSATFKERPYYWQLRRTIDGNQKVWLNGDHDWHNGKFDAFNDSGDTIQINDDGDIINVTINEGGGITQSELDAALALKADLELSIGTYSTELTFDEDKDIYQDVTTPVFTLAGSGNVNGVGIILRLNTPTSVTFPVNFEASPNSATLDATKLNVYMLVYFSNWNGTGTPRVVYTNTLFTAI